MKGRKESTITLRFWMRVLFPDTGDTEGGADLGGVELRLL